VNCRDGERLKQINAALSLPKLLPGKETARNVMRNWLPLPLAVLSVNDVLFALMIIVFFLFDFVLIIVYTYIYLIFVSF
jgi:hypothetical protein